ncbi:hypothetical protein [Streptomyces sp. AC154]|uniref:hypothetical protein n=1 Tax=Streptomyces sp. AC154 TaxID=3143184 RepID=UPI003F7F7DFA
MTNAIGTPQAFELRTRIHPQEREHDMLLRTFYSVPRAGKGLSDGGGPFGFDITTALQVDFLMRAYGCDGVVESGTHCGDTTEYLARMYPALPIRTCEIDTTYAAVAKYRLRDLPNAEVHIGDSALLVPELVRGLDRPLVFLDAHWRVEWPLRTELSAVERGVVVVDDFDIGHPRFGYDHYQGVLCGPELIRNTLKSVTRMHIGNPLADYPLPCLQVGRRSGTGYLLRDLSDAAVAGKTWFAPVLLRPRLVTPDWDVPAMNEVRR